MEKVLVLLSTYNGERFLREQLDSIYAQEGIDLHILVRDDGSKDSTLDILNEYKKNRGKATIIEGENIGAALSFYELMFEARKKYCDYDYYAFSDQDDCWFPQKLLKSVNALQNNNSKYQLYYGKVIATDASLRPINSARLSPSFSLGTNIVSSRALGCTMVFNRTLLDKACVISTYLKLINNNDYIPYHDGWISLVAYSLDGHVVVGSEPLMYYRQHGHNVIGTGLSRFKLVKNRLCRYLKSDGNKSTKCRIVLDLLDSELPQQNKNLLYACAYYKSSAKQWFQLLCSKALFQYGFIDNIGTFGVIVLRKF